MLWRGRLAPLVGGASARLLCPGPAQTWKQGWMEGLRLLRVPVMTRSCSPRLSLWGALRVAREPAFPSVNMGRMSRQL